MYQSNYGYYPNNTGLRQTIAPQVPMAQPIAALKGHPVSSLEEARAMSIDFDGSVFFFPDLANKKIYTKQINADGTATLNMYGLEDLPQKTPVMRNHKEGRSPISRKTYMDSKENNQDKNTQIHELENYMAELSQDIMEMAQIASPEEKSILQKKLATLSTKIM